MGARQATAKQEAGTSGSGRVDPDELLQEGLEVMQREIRAYAKKKALTTFEAKALVDYVKAVHGIARDARKDEETDLADLTDEELAAEAAKLEGKAA